MKGKKKAKKIAKKKGVFVTPEVVARSRQPATPPVAVFSIPKPAPGVVPEGHGMAMDDGLVQSANWANGGLIAQASSFGGNLSFLGYPFLSELAQRPEYRRISETIATEMTRKWIRFAAKGQDDDKADEIGLIQDEFDRLKVRQAFQKVAALDGFFGRSHLYLDLGTGKNPNELKTAIGDGFDKISQAKVKKGGLERLQVIEPVWTYPTSYNSNDPLRPDWYKPESWFVMGKQLHGSRLLTFIGREVPDMLKPAYMFGGLSMSQMAMPYVDNWLRTRQSVADIISAFSTFVLSTNLQETMQGDGQQLFARAALFNNLRNNRGLLMTDKESEEFKNVSAPLSSLDALQAQTQEHMSSVSGVPIVKLLGVQPAGLNASSQGELESFYTNIGAYQEHLFREPLTRVLGFAMLSVLGRVDPDITFSFEPLWSMSEKEIAELRKMEAETSQIYIDLGVLSQEEDRKRIAADPNTPWPGLDVSDMPDLLGAEEEGLEPEGGRPDPIAEEGLAGKRKAA